LSAATYAAPTITMRTDAKITVDRTVEVAIFVLFNYPPPSSQMT